MSSMRFLDKLLDGVKVQWMALGEIGEFIRGNGMQKKDFVEVGFPAIHSSQSVGLSSFKNSLCACAD